MLTNMVLWGLIGAVLWLNIVVVSEYYKPNNYEMKQLLFMNVIIIIGLVYLIR